MAGDIQAQLERSAPGAFDVERYATAATAREDLLDTVVQGAHHGRGHRPRAAGGCLRLGADRRRARRLRAGGGSSARARWLTVAAFALTAGLLTAVTADWVVGALSGAFWALAAVNPLVAFGVAGAVHGLARSFGLAGIAVATLGILFLGQASSGGAVTALYLPEFFGAVSGWLPTGAGLAAVRNVVYFDGAAIAPPLLVLAGWGLLGLALDLAARGYPRLAVGHPRRSRTAPSVA
jgi:hypothetical protein